MNYQNQKRAYFVGIILVMIYTVGWFAFLFFSRIWWRDPPGGGLIFVSLDQIVWNIFPFELKPYLFFAFVLVLLINFFAIVLFFWFCFPNSFLIRFTRARKKFFLWYCIVFAVACILILSQIVLFGGTIKNQSYFGFDPLYLFVFAPVGLMPTKLHGFSIGSPLIFLFLVPHHLCIAFIISLIGNMWACKKKAS